MKITLRTNEGIMYARIHGIIAHEFLRQVMPIAVHVPLISKDKDKVGYRITEDIALRYPQFTIYVWTDSVIAVTN